MAEPGDVLAVADLELVDAFAQGLGQKSLLDHHVAPTRSLAVHPGLDLAQSRVNVTLLDVHHRLQRVLTRCPAVLLSVNLQR